MLFPKVRRISKTSKVDSQKQTKVSIPQALIRPDGKSSTDMAVTQTILKALEDTFRQFPESAPLVQTHFLDFISQVKNKLDAGKQKGAYLDHQQVPQPLFFQEVSQIHDSFQETYRQARQTIQRQLIEQNRQLTKQNLKLRSQMDDMSIERSQLASRCREAGIRCNELQQTLENIQEIRSAGSQHLCINVQRYDRDDLTDKCMLSPRTTLPSSPRYFSSRNSNFLFQARSQDRNRQYLRHDLVTQSTQTLSQSDNPEEKVESRPRRRLLVRRRN